MVLMSVVFFRFSHSWVCGFGVSSTENPEFEQYGAVSAAELTVCGRSLIC